MVKTSNNKKPFIIGLTGSIGMGKTTVSNMFSKLGVPVSNADMDVAKSMEAGGSCVAEVANAFPSTLHHNDDSKPYIDRASLGRIVLDNFDKLDRLEKILHPVVAKIRENFVKKMSRDGHNIVLCDIPLLFENQLEQEMNLTICVSAPKDVQRKRVLARAGMTEEKLDRFIARQMPDTEKRKKANIVIDTSDSLENTHKAVEKIIKDISKGKHSKN